MRLVLLVSTLATLNLAAASAAAQSHNPDIQACNDKSGKEGIVGCSNAISSGKLDTKNLAIAFSNRGLKYTDQEDFSRAIADYGESIRINPQYENAFNDRGLVYIKLKDFVRALADFSRALKLNPQYSNAYNARCWTRVALLSKQLDLARKDCDAAVRLSPNEPDYRDSRGLVALKQKRFADAWKDFDDAAKIGPNDASYMYGRGIAAMRLGRTVEGKADLEKAQNLDPRIAATYAGYGIGAK